MVNILTASMVCFPYVIAGVGQAIIMGTNPAGRTVRDRKIPLATFDVSNEGKRCKICFIPGCPVFASR
jgi:ABC-type tungstate transport system substrate-binding protein